MTRQTLFSFFKGVIVAIIVVFPIVLAMNTFVEPLLLELPSIVITIIYVLVIAPLMTLFMPIIMKKLSLKDKNSN